MIRAQTRAKIKGFLEGFLDAQLIKHEKLVASEKGDRKVRAAAKAGKLKPFHLAILPPEAGRLFSFERSFSTSLGNTFEECARLISADVHKEVARNRVLFGKVSHVCLEEIERVRSLIDGGKCVDYPSVVENILKASSKQEVQIRTITDVYLKAKSGEEYYFEIKSPKPNKGQAIEVTDRLLRTHAIRRLGPPKVKTYFAMAYNPYGTRADYTHGFATQHLDMKNQVLIQEEFWDIVGGAGTYKELLDIYLEVGREKGRQVIQRLGYEFN